MSENEITRIVLRLDNLETRWGRQIKEHEKEIREIIRAEIQSFRSGVMWFVGTVFSMMFAIIGFIAINYFITKTHVRTNTEATGTIISIMSHENPGSYILEDLNNKYNPKRGVD